MAPPLRILDSRPSDSAGVDWEQAVRIATVLKAWDRPPGLIFVISIDARSPDDNRVFVSISSENTQSKIPTMVLGVDRLPAPDSLDKLDTFVRGWFEIRPKGVI